MPPQRTVPPARPIKTERTHEENQERAYIAASRRSDRSLEARVESARRASEIHKRRTGRSLRVTEQDVINEEMYEEEDDDLPSQYRRLTAHLQTNSSAFNQRLAAYLTGQVGVRTAIDQYLSNSYGQQPFPNSQPFPINQSMYQNPAMAQQFQNQLMQQSGSPTSTYRQAPYQIPSMQQRSSMHARSASIANPEMNANKSQSPTLPDDKKRALSLASAPATTASPEQTQTPRSNPASTPKPLSASAPQTGFSQQQHLSQPFQPSYTGGNFQPDHSLFTTALPAESQMLLGSALDPRDPMTNMFMAGSQYMPNSYFNFDSTLPPTFTVGKGTMGGQMYPSFDGLNATLAPSELELNSGLDFQYAGQTSFFDAGMKETTGNGLETPGGGDFNLFIDQDQWNETAPSSQS